MNDLPFLVAHTQRDVWKRLAEALAPREVRWVQDPFAATAEAAAAEVAAIILQHPLRGVEAPALAARLREQNAQCPLVVIAEHATGEELQVLARELGEGAVVLDSITLFIASVERTRRDRARQAAEAERAERDRAGPLGMSAPEYDASVGRALLALKVEHDACSQWIALDLPPVLIALLDGSRSATRLAAESGIREEDLVRTLQKLEALHCLDFVTPPDCQPEPEAILRVEAARDGWTPLEPDREPDEAGSLRDRPAAELLLQLKRDAVTGVLVVESPTRTMRLDLAGGSPVQASGSPPETGLGEFLLRLGFIDCHGLERLLREGDSNGDLLGDTAIRLGLVTSPQLLATLSAQLESAIRVLVAEEAGSYRLYREKSQLRRVSPAQKPVEMLVEEALRADGAACARLVGEFVRVNLDRAVRATDRALDLLPAFRFGGRIQRLLRQLDGGTLRDALDASQLPRDETELALYLFWAAGGLDVAVPAGAYGAVPLETALLAPTAPGPGPRVEILPPKAGDAPVDHEPAAQKHEVRDVLERASELMASKEYVQALLLVDEALRAAPDDPNLLAALGWATFRTQPGSHAAREEARRVLKRALDADPNLLSAVVALGKIARLEQDVAEANALFQRALAIDAANEEA